jgi:hypothetical protein
MSERCSGEVWGHRAFRPSRCSRVASLEHEGKHYCKVHHPPTVEVKQKEKHTRWQQQWNAEADISNHKNAAARLLARFTAAQLVNAVDLESLLREESSSNRPKEAVTD